MTHVKPGTTTACQTTCKHYVRTGSRHQDKVTFPTLLHDTRNSEDALQRQNYTHQKTSLAAGNTQTASLSMPTIRFPTGFHVLLTGKFTSTGASLCFIPIKELECSLRTGTTTFGQRAVSKIAPTMVRMNMCWPWGLGYHTIHFKEEAVFQRLICFPLKFPYMSHCSSRC